jgi:hypothetical protein
MSTYPFWRSAIERAVNTFVQSLLAIFSATGVGLLTVSWIASLSTAGMAAGLSVLMSMASAPVGLGEPNNPSLLSLAPRLPRDHRGRAYRPEPVFPRKGTGQQVAHQVPCSLLKQVGGLHGSGCGDAPERGRGRLHLVGGVRAATHVVSIRDRRTALIDTRLMRNAGYRSNRSPTGS